MSLKDLYLFVGCLQSFLCFKLIRISASRRKHVKSWQTAVCARNFRNLRYLCLGTSPENPDCFLCICIEMRLSTAAPETNRARRSDLMLNSLTSRILYSVPKALPDDCALKGSGMSLTCFKISCIENASKIVDDMQPIPRRSTSHT